MLIALLLLALQDAGWPKGSEAILNHPGRISWGEKDGRSQAEFSGRIPEEMLEVFARIDTYSKRIVIHEPRDKWSFSAWNLDAWEGAPGLANNAVKHGETIVQLDLYADVPLPGNIPVVDRRMRGKSGNVIEGKLTDLDGNPLVGKVILQNTRSCRTPSYAVAQANTDVTGRWMLEHQEVSDFRLIAEAADFIPRELGRFPLDDEPQWKTFTCALARPVTVSGRVTDEAGCPLPGIGIFIGEMKLDSGGIYEPPDRLTTTTDADGRFSEGLPRGSATLQPYGSGWYGPPLTVTPPGSEIAIKMVRTSSVQITVDFNGGERPPHYGVSIEPETPDGIYPFWGQIDQANLRRFDNLQPRRYLIRGQGEGGEKSGPMTVELESGKLHEVTLKAK